LHQEADTDLRPYCFVVFKDPSVVVDVAAVDWLSGGVAVVGKRVGTAVDSVRWAEVSKETACYVKERFSTYMYH
jgi:hypothetical protein